jgi:hypothetical protein
MKVEEDWLFRLAGYAHGPVGYGDIHTALSQVQVLVDAAYAAGRREAQAVAQDHFGACQEMPCCGLAIAKAILVKP